MVLVGRRGGRVGGRRSAADFGKKTVPFSLIPFAALSPNPFFAEPSSSGHPPPLFSFVADGVVGEGHSGEGGVTTKEVSVSLERFFGEETEKEEGPYENN